MDVTSLQEKFNTLQVIDHEILGLDHTLASLPSRITHQVMIPVGQVAFMPGKVYRTNEIFVNLGGGYSVWRSTSQAREILSRRRVQVQQELEQVSFYLNSVRANQSVKSSTNDPVSVPSSDDDDPFEGVLKPVEIREKYDPDAVEANRRKLYEEASYEDTPKIVVEKPDIRQQQEAMEMMKKLTLYEEEFMAEMGDVNFDTISMEEIDAFILRKEQDRNSGDKPLGKGSNFNTDMKAELDDLHKTSKKVHFEESSIDSPSNVEESSLQNNEHDIKFDTTVGNLKKTSKSVHFSENDTIHTIAPKPSPYPEVGSNAFTGRIVENQNPAPPKASEKPVKMSLFKQRLQEKKQ